MRTLESASLACIGALSVAMAITAPVAADLLAPSSIAMNVDAAAQLTPGGSQLDFDELYDFGGIGASASVNGGPDLNNAAASSSAGAGLQIDFGTTLRIFNSGNLSVTRSSLAQATASFNTSSAIVFELESAATLRLSLTLQVADGNFFASMSSSFSLHGPAGLVYNNSVNSSGTASELLFFDLLPGTYTVNVGATGMNTGFLLNFPDGAHAIADVRMTIVPAGPAWVVVLGALIGMTGRSRRRATMTA